MAEAEEEPPYSKLKSPLWTEAASAHHPMCGRIPTSHWGNGRAYTHDITSQGNTKKWHCCDLDYPIRPAGPWKAPDKGHDHDHDA